MIDPRRKPWLGAAILVAVLYLAMSFASAGLADAAGSDRMRFVWRLSAFVGAGVVLAAHVGHEHLRLRNPSRRAAWHAAAGAALGGFAIALAANLHELGSDSSYRPRLLVALAVWPLLTGLPAFLLAKITVLILERAWRRS
jgi:peptidoglycan/LPS O-acetylase OafA/YrhL